MASAIHREKRLKKWTRVWKVKLINDFNPQWQDLHLQIDANINLVEEFATRKGGRDKHLLWWPALSGP